MNGMKIIMLSERKKNIAFFTHAESRNNNKT
jgi:hypothetical protein